MTARERFTRRVEPEPNSGCWLWVGRVFYDTGYGDWRAFEGEVLAHRVAWRLCYGTIPARAFVLHRCDVRRCVNPAHLYLGDHKQNMRDMVARQRADDRRGDKNTQAKLTTADVLEIRRLQASDLSYLEIASRFNVSSSLVCKIKTREVWAHV